MDVSLNIDYRHEWALKSRLFNEILADCPGLDIDLFAARLNHKLAVY